MNLPASYRHDYDYEPPRTPNVYDTPRIVERGSLLVELAAMVRPLRRRAVRRWMPRAVVDAGRASMNRTVDGSPEVPHCEV